MYFKIIIVHVGSMCMNFVDTTYPQIYSPVSLILVCVQSQIYFFNSYPGTYISTSQQIWTLSLKKLSSTVFKIVFSVSLCSLSYIYIYSKNIPKTSLNLPRAPIKILGYVYGVDYVFSILKVYSKIFWTMWLNRSQNISISINFTQCYILLLEKIFFL